MMVICTKCREHHNIVFKCTECGENVCIGCMTELGLNLGLCKDCVVDIFNMRYEDKINAYKETA